MVSSSQSLPSKLNSFKKKKYGDKYAAVQQQEQQEKQQEQQQEQPSEAQDAHGLYQSNPSMVVPSAPSMRLPSRRVARDASASSGTTPSGSSYNKLAASMDTEDLQAQQEESGYGIFPASSGTTSHNNNSSLPGNNSHEARALGLPTSEDVDAPTDGRQSSSSTLAPCPTDEDNLSTASSTIQPGWVFPAGRHASSSNVFKADPPSQRYTSSTSIKSGRVRQASTFRHSRQQFDMERKLAELELANDLEPPAGSFGMEPPAAAAAFESSPLEDPPAAADDDPHGMDQPEWTQRESSLSFMTGGSSVRSSRSHRHNSHQDGDDASSYSDVQSWISLDRVLGTAPSFPPPVTEAAARTKQQRASLAAQNLCTIPLGVVQDSSASSTHSSSSKSESKWGMPTAASLFLQGWTGSSSSSGPATNDTTTSPSSQVAGRVSLPRPPPPPSDRDRFVDEELSTTQEDPHEQHHAMTKRTRKWDMVVLLAFIVTTCVIGIAITLKVLGGGGGSSSPRHQLLRGLPCAEVPTTKTTAWCQDRRID